MRHHSTLFQYRCRQCGKAGFFERLPEGVACHHCGFAHRVSSTGVIDFAPKSTEQDAYFDGIYSAGRMHKIDELNEQPVRTYENSREPARSYLSLCGYDLARPVENLSILDLACGSGWVTAGLLQHASIRNCKFHAFDISPDGPELLAGFVSSHPGANEVELSVQDATAMVFEDASFDVIVGSSVLHHFDDVERFLRDCKRILRPGGVATFGEPFALGYGLGAAALVVAQRQTGRAYQGLTECYNDIAFRIKSPASALAPLVDKHLFFQSSFLNLAKKIGFKEIAFIPLAPRTFYRNDFIHELMLERGIADAELERAANSIYRVFFDLFDAETYGQSVAAFIQVVMRA